MFYDTLHSSCIAKPKKCENLYNVKLPSGFWSLYLEGVPKMKHIYTTDIIYIYTYTPAHKKNMNIPSQHLHIYFLYICELKKKASRIKSIKLTLLCKSRVSRFYVRVSSPFPSGCGQLAWVLWQQWSSFNCAMGAASLLRSLMSSKDLT